MLAAFADAAMVSAELFGADATQAPQSATVIPISKWRRRITWVAPSLVAAAIVVAVVLFQSPSRPADDLSYHPRRFAEGLHIKSAATSELPVNRTRGTGVVVSDLGRAIRIGALLTDFEFESVQGRNGAAQAGEIARLLTDLAGGPLLAAKFQELATAGRAPEQAEVREQLGRMAIELVDRPLANAGAWLEAARIAASTSTASDLDALVASSALETLTEDQRLRSETREAVGRLKADLQATPRNLTRIRAQLDSTLGVLAR